MRGLPSILSLFHIEFNKFNNTSARMLDSIYHMTLRLFSVEKRHNFVICYRRQYVEPLVVYRFYFITSSEFNSYQMQVKLVFFYSEKISYFFTSD